MIMQKICSLIICCAVLGCASRPDSAPVENATDIPNYLQQNAAPATFKPVAPVPVTEETPSSASMGSLSNSNSVKPLAQQEPGTTTISRSAAKPPAASADKASTVPAGSGEGSWMVPTAGKTDAYKTGAKGIDISGTEGQAIYASNSGKVVYSGNGLKGYGNLIIIKHDETYLTAYAHNKANLVKEGASVKRGQRIAEMGTDDSGKAVLHFELRKNGKPIDPFTLIKN